MRRMTQRFVLGAGRSAMVSGLDLWSTGHDFCPALETRSSNMLPFELRSSWLSSGKPHPRGGPDHSMKSPFSSRFRARTISMMILASPFSSSTSPFAFGRCFPTATTDGTNRHRARSGREVFAGKQTLWRRSERNLKDNLKDYVGPLEASKDTEDPGRTRADHDQTIRQRLAER